MTQKTTNLSPSQKQQPTPPEPPQEAKTNNSIPLSDLGEQLAGLVRTHGGQLQVAGLESAYQEMYGGPCPRLGFPSLAALLHALPPDSGLSSRGKKGRKTLVLLPDPGEKESLTATQTIPAARISAPEPVAPALMDQPVPSNVPSPDLQPELPPDSDLMGFESPLPPSSEVEAVLRTLVNKTEEQRPRRPRLAAQFSVPLH
ncbi:hypothetical protein LAZ67_2003101 [Cordylochernes scorpioides]|uniref:Uncharacterized protein n=1 Tax=Cordylochernes scorpioides TaxID=51811 RepID=A0ABY6K5Z1_9ARAC|nr:hypothetical protein LAZ67_2003101 [Cordylochernes scorpioides]